LFFIIDSGVNLPLPAVYPVSNIHLNQLKDVLEHSLMEVLGDRDYHLLTAHISENLPFPLAECYHLAIRMYGGKSAAGIFHRAGRAGFCRLIMNLGVEAGLVENEYKLLPMRKKVIRGLNLLASVFELVPGQEIQVENSGDYFYWKVSGCTHCQTTTPVDGCSYYIGLLQEYMAWLGSGRVYWVDEIECRSTRDSQCVFRINQSPIE
jgi:predicted hydrocarbon binding protein